LNTKECTGIAHTGLKIKRINSGKATNEISWSLGGARAKEKCQTKIKMQACFLIMTCLQASKTITQVPAIRSFRRSVQR
jgi:hypothetical protein